MKKVIALMMAAVMSLFALTGCAEKTDSEVHEGQASAEIKDDGKIKVIATIFPEYDWAKAIIGDTDHVELSLLLNNGVDMHSYQPTADDMLAISTCDMFIYVGGQSDEWMDDALAQAMNKEMKVVNLMDLLGDKVKHMEIPEGAEHTGHEHHDHEHQFDEHVWLSVKAAKVICGEIAESLSEIDPDNTETYKNNLEAYEKQLDELDKSYQAVADNASKDTVVFADRYPFRYLMEDYGINVYAAFAGCSAETEVSFNTITFLKDKIDTLELGAVLTIEHSDEKIAKTVIDNTRDKNQKILELNSMQATKEEDIKNGASYIGIMEDNLSKLKEALD